MSVFIWNSGALDVFYSTDLKRCCHWESPFSINVVEACLNHSIASSLYVFKYSLNKRSTLYTNCGDATCFSSDYMLQRLLFTLITNKLFSKTKVEFLHLHVKYLYTGSESGHLISKFQVP